MKQIRMGVFETNSSSVHSLSIMSEENWKKWQAGEISYDVYDDKIGTPEQINGDFQSFGDYEERRDRYEESFERHYTTESDDKIVIFGYAGYDG